MNILNGVSTGVVIASVPGALVNELMKNIAHSWSGALDNDIVDGQLASCICGDCACHICLSST
nr:hypothetical protein [Lactobacillus helveticus]